MMFRLARAYVAVLLVVELLLFTSSLLLHISTWAETQQLPIESGKVLLIGSLFGGFLSACLAKERNVWKNEFKSCPVWLKAAALVFAVYGMGVVIWRTVLYPVDGVTEDLIAMSAMPLSLSALFVCIPYAVFLREAVQPAELIKRSGISFSAGVLGIGAFLLHRAGYLANQAR